MQVVVVFTTVPYGKVGSIHKRVQVLACTLFGFDGEEEGGGGGVDYSKATDADLFTVEGCEILGEHLTFQSALFVSGIDRNKQSTVFIEQGDSRLYRLHGSGAQRGDLLILSAGEITEIENSRAYFGIYVIENV